MEKKPSLLDRKKIVFSCDSDLNQKVLNQALKVVGEYESIVENNLVKFLARTFMFEPKLVILSHEKLEDNLMFAEHLRNNDSFYDLPIICISNPMKKEKKAIKKKIDFLRVNYFYIPFNNLELTKAIKTALEA